MRFKHCSICLIFNNKLKMLKILKFVGIQKTILSKDIKSIYIILLLDYT